jgi:cellulose synthase/poly-beta-1,6-N-acetylglucosamine synthase-like glycosyltransferase
MTGLGQLLVVVASVLLALLLVPACIVTAQVLAHARVRASGPGGPRVATTARGPVAILVPAHDEADDIAHTLSTMLPQLRPADRLVVIADNCSDATAEIARTAGAEVVERSSSARGKGFAIAHGIDHLRRHPPLSVVVVDADCDLGPGALEVLLGDLERTARPVQACYLMVNAPDATLPRRMAEFAWRVHNWVRPSGSHRLHMPCQLMGTGMAFTWEMIRAAPLANASIVEDMQLGIDLALGGCPPVYCERALVTSRFPLSKRASRTQRTRWEHGHLDMIVRQLPRLLIQAAKRGDALLLGFALDLAVPPLAMLAGAMILACALALSGALLGATAAPFVLSASLLGMLTLTVLVGWRLRGRDLVSLAELLTAPWYVLARIPIYLRFAFDRQKQWVRTDRGER